MSQRVLIEAPAKAASAPHDDGNSKQKAGAVNAIDPARSEERSWKQRRTCDLILKEFPDGNGFSSKDWSRCYAQAKDEWSEKETNEAVRESES